MSAQQTYVSTLFHQRFLACGGFYRGALDGKWGKQTDQADVDAQAAYEALRSSMGTLDPRTEKNIATLLPIAQQAARRFMKIAGSSCKIISGTRTYAEQDALHAQGRGVPGRVVTNAVGGQSNHNFAIAWDVGIFDGTDYVDGSTRAEEQMYISLAHRIKADNSALEWGGDWHSIVDNPHYQMATGKTLSQVRAAFESGTLLRH